MSKKFYLLLLMLFAFLLASCSSENDSGNDGQTSQTSSSSSSAEENEDSSSSSDEAVSSSGTSSSGDSSSSEGVISSSGGVSPPSSSSSRASSSSSSSRASSSSSGGVSPPSSSSIAASSSANSGSLTFGTRFDPEMHGLTPGATTASLNLNWWSDTTAAISGRRALVRLFDASGNNLIKMDTGSIQTVTFGSSVGSQYRTGKPRRRHRVTVTDLIPNTSYKYSVSNNGNDWSHSYDYKTPPAGAFTFAAVSDPQLNHTNTDNNGLQGSSSKYKNETTAWGWNEAVKKVAAAGATFITSAGDQVDRMEYSEHEYQNFFAPEPLRNIPYAPTVGNHDLHNQFYDHFYIPNPMVNVSTSNSYGYATAGAGNYYFLYNNLLIVVLNTGMTYNVTASSAATSVSNFKKAIDDAKTTYSGQYDWLIVQHHTSTMTVSAHACEKEAELFVQAGFEQMMTEKGVDLVIAGHDHIYVRSHLMKWNASNGYSVKSTDGKGTIYLTLSTSGGIKFYPAFSTSYANNGTETFPMLNDGTKGCTEMAKAYMSSSTSTITAKTPLSTELFYPVKWNDTYAPSYTICEVSGTSMKLTTYLIDGTKIDEFTMTPKGR